jgi:hypothetical protein
VFGLLLITGSSWVLQVLTSLTIYKLFPILANSLL